MKVLGVIPARGGSQRVKDKNIKLLAGKPLIQYTIEAAMNSKLLNDCIISTDNIRIKEVCESLGASVPFLRPDTISGDKTGDKPVLLHALEWMEKDRDCIYDAVVYLRPTSPFKTSAIIDSVIRKLNMKEIDSVRTMTKSEGVFHPYWMYWKQNDGRAKPFDKNNGTDKYYQSQLLPEIFRLNGVVDGIKAEIIRTSEQPLYGKNMHILEIKEEFSMDIDTEFDFKLCEALIPLMTDFKF